MDLLPRPPRAAPHVNNTFKQNDNAQKPSEGKGEIDGLGPRFFVLKPRCLVNSCVRFAVRCKKAAGRCASRSHRISKGITTRYCAATSLPHLSSKSDEQGSCLYESLLVSDNNFDNDPHIEQEAVEEEDFSEGSRLCGSPGVSYDGSTRRARG